MAQPPRAKPTLRRLRIGEEVPPAEPLHADGLMHPKGITTLYGESNVGKGWVACWVICNLVEGGYRPTILDYESVQWEWQSRLYGMGIRPGDGVEHLMADEALGPRLVLPLQEELRAIGSTHLIVDSASAARGRVGASDAGGQDAAMAIFRTLKDLGIPCLLIAHRSKDGGAGPLGSVQYRNQSSMVLRAEADGAMATKVWVDDVNDRPRPTVPFIFKRIPAPGGYATVWRDEGKPLTLVKDKPETLSQAILRVFARLNRNLTIDDVFRELKRDGWKNADGKEPDYSTLSAMIRKLTGQKLLMKVDRGRYVIPVDQTGALD